MYVACLPLILIRDNGLAFAQCPNRPCHGQVGLGLNSESEEVIKQAYPTQLGALRPWTRTGLIGSTLQAMPTLKMPVVSVLDTTLQMEIQYITEKAWLQKKLITGIKQIIRSLFNWNLGDWLSGDYLHDLLCLTCMDLQESDMPFTLLWIWSRLSLTVWKAARKSLLICRFRRSISPRRLRRIFRLFS